MSDGSYLSLTTHVLDDGEDAWYGVAVERWHPDLGLTRTWDTSTMLEAGQLEFIPGEYAPYHANSVTWLLSPLAATMTGSTVLVDHGGSQRI